MQAGESKRGLVTRSDTLQEVNIAAVNAA